MTKLRHFFALLAIGFSISLTKAAPIVPSIFSDHMVLQRGQQNPLWGKANPGEKIVVTVADQIHSTTATADGNWRIKLDPLETGGPYQIGIKGDSEITLKDVLVGEVWLCSGQSNMEWYLDSTTNNDIEQLTAKYPEIRMISAPHLGTQKTQWDFEAEWLPTTPETVKKFSAIAYYYGRILHQVLDVPIGLVNVSWGGSAAQSWIRRELIEDHPAFEGMMNYWDDLEENYNYSDALAGYKKKYAVWEKENELALANNQTPPEKPKRVWDHLKGNNRPSNIYHGMLKPVIGYGIKGCIWYQGESNTKRPVRYHPLFSFLINSWREEWGQGDFPFYWVQLAGYASDDDDIDSRWAWLREAQTKTLLVPQTGQAVITDLGESRDIHPRDKQTVATRLARIALDQTYGFDLISKSPEYKSMEVEENRAFITFNHVESELYSFNDESISGFTIAGANKVFYSAQASIIDSDTVKVWSDQVRKPASVRYNWANTTTGNLIVREPHLPVTPFRTDDWPMVDPE